MAKKSLLQVLKQVQGEYRLSKTATAELIGVTWTTFDNFYKGKPVRDQTLQKIRAFTENPQSYLKDKGKKAGQKSASTKGTFTAEMLEGVAYLGTDDLLFVAKVMQKTGAAKLSLDDVLELIKLRSE